MTRAHVALQQEGFASDSVRMIQSVRREAADLQILLFSATFNERVKTFALKVVGPEANQVFVPKENLSLDVIKQYRVVRSPGGGLRGGGEGTARLQPQTARMPPSRVPACCVPRWEAD